MDPAKVAQMVEVLSAPRVTPFACAGRLHADGFG
jgi:hypothetical protein